MINQDLPQVKTVKLLFVGMDDQQQAMFKMAFKMHSTTNYQVIAADSGETPELVIVDGDNSDGITTWQKAKGDYHSSTVVYFAKNPPSVTAPYLPKPIKFDTLFLNLRNLMQGNGVWVIHANNQSAASDQSVDEHKIAAHSVSSRHHHRAAEVVIPRFDPQHGLLGALRKTLSQQRDTAIVVDDRPVLMVFPAIQRVWVAVDSAKLKELCRQENLDIQTKQMPPDNSLHERANATVTSSMWQIALWTANGRLVQPLNPNTVFRLDRWPNLTRLAPLPESMRLSAFLTKTSVSLNMLYKLLPADMEDILNYIAATYLTDYLIVTQQVQETAHAFQQPVPHTVEARSVQSAPAREQTEAVRPPQQQEKGGILSRFMKKLLNK